MNGSMKKKLSAKVGVSGGGIEDAAWLVLL
jgi:hypothetical protein